MLELYVHGSNTIINSILTDILKTNRVRFAKPGEFTERAFLNGKLDLTQANSILKKYLNKKSSPLNFNRENLGLLSKVFIKLQNLTYDIIFNIESVLEFSTETTIYFNKILYKNKIKLAISILKMFLKKKIKIFNSGFINVGLIGSPNSGKSSLINKLFNKKLSLVSYVGGTTRDNISISLSKFPVHLIDTAGLDKISLCVTDNLLLDYLGIKKTLDTVEQMDLYILLLSFFNIKLMPIFFNLLCKKIFIFNTLVIFNKKDVLISHSLN
ncbi:GTP-binding protein [Candidatus Pinguicoccus supinus]|uniref:GTP-binding protein n=1 Tax=Candidatus Pinguicoccus supinus TaxID=2529394 RepID=A0A7T0BRG6_9BACT|nr:GTP-binding protein [Candidatus Pinguicoccus supinus]